MSEITYPEPGQIGYTATIVAGGSTIATSETDLIVISNGGALKKSQLTMYYDITFGSATSVKFRYYYSPDGGTTYFQVPIKSLSTGILADIPSVIDSTSPAQSTHVRVVEDLPFSGATVFKITGTAVGASATLNSLYVFGRDN